VDDDEVGETGSVLEGVVVVLGADIVMATMDSELLVITWELELVAMVVVATGEVDTVVVGVEGAGISGVSASSASVTVSGAAGVKTRVTL